MLFVSNKATTTTRQSIRRERKMSHKLTIADFHLIATERGGECLSTHYENRSAKLRFRCAEGHEFESQASNVKINQSWCPQCSGKMKHTLSHYQAIARERGGECLATQYQTNMIPMPWRCAEGHEWSARGRDVEAGKWCPHCAKRAPITIETYKAVARGRGGRCLSSSCENQHEKLEWECGEHHRWLASGKSVRGHGTWCPICSRCKGEKLLGEVLDSIAPGVFAKDKPDWLEGPKGALLELDFFYPERMIAFEYQGRQHYAKHPLWHRDQADFEYQLVRDQVKVNICAQQGVILVTVPGVLQPTFDKIKALLLALLRELAIPSLTFA